MNKTDIEYLDYTWNPITMRCTPKSTGCINCWHLRVADRLMNNPKMPKRKRDAWGGGSPFFDEKKLDEPVKKKDPAIIGVQFMGDLFHWSIPFMRIDAIWSRMAKAPQHTFIVLTKRPNQMAEFMCQVGNFNYGVLPNVWIGVSCSDQKDADQYIPVLAKIRAAVKFVSFEPLLGRVCINDYRIVIDWAICGCESGKNRRKTDHDTIRWLRDQCTLYRIPFFLKQMEINGKIFSMPILDGRVWKQYPKDSI